MYENRREAGKVLAEKLRSYRDTDALVLALPRGGIEVGYELAEAIDAELDVLVVRKIGAPQNPELGLGAIASYGARFVDEGMARAMGVTNEKLEEIEQSERKELRRRERTYRGDIPEPEVAGRTAIIVDDGIATGGTARAAIRAVRSLDPGRIVLAVPVAPPDSVAELKEDVDELVCPQTPSPFRAIGEWYRQFEQTSDEQVVELLNARREHSGVDG